MRERPNRTVSKTVVSQGTVGSNPTPSAGQGWFPVETYEVRPGAIPQKSLTVRSTDTLLTWQEQCANGSLGCGSCGSVSDETR
jgi:hypothetical protein